MAAPHSSHMKGGTMEWLEFNRWSHDVEERLALQATMLHACARRPPANPMSESAEARAQRLRRLLQDFPRTNPWGHPDAEC